MLHRAWMLASVLTLLCSPTLAHAAYQVEIVVFRDLWVPVGDSVTALGDIRTQDAVPASERTQLASRGISVLGAPLSFAGAWAVLSGSQRYSPLLQLAWTQNQPAARGGPALRLLRPSAAPVQDPHTGAMREIPELDGQVRLNVSDLIFLDLDLYFTPEEVQFPVTLRLRERRPVRKGEWHHFDGHEFGVLARVVDAP